MRSRSRRAHHTRDVLRLRSGALAAAHHDWILVRIATATPDERDPDDPARGHLTRPESADLHRSEPWISGSRVSPAAPRFNVVWLGTFAGLALILALVVPPRRCFLTLVTQVYARARPAHGRRSASSEISWQWFFANRCSLSPWGLRWALRRHCSERARCLDCYSASVPWIPRRGFAVTSLLLTVAFSRG